MKLLHVDLAGAVKINLLKYILNFLVLLELLLSFEIVCLSSLGMSSLQPVDRIKAIQLAAMGLPDFLRRAIESMKVLF